MPIIKSAIKRDRQAKKRNAYNVAVKNDVKAKIKVARNEIAGGNIKDNTKLVSAIKEIDKAVKKGVINKHTASRKKSRLTKSYNTIADKPYGTEATNKPKVKKQPATKASTPKATKPSKPKKPSTKKPSTAKPTK